jgi:hypothetical protein
MLPPGAPFQSAVKPSGSPDLNRCRAGPKSEHAPHPQSCGPELNHPQLSDSFIRTKRARCQLRIETGSLLEFGCWHLVRVLSWMVGSSDITRENRLGECQIATRCVNFEGGELSRFRSSGRLTDYTEVILSRAQLPVCRPERSRWRGGRCRVGGLRHLRRCRVWVTRRYL